ncbi:hypothetical protein FACS1894147_07840 [Spirochaetia bacterium]|nr:hypothetical protein FACS1894147_07840 [Spirochaetia bacterium]
MDGSTETAVVFQKGAFLKGDFTAPQLFQQHLPAALFYIGGEKSGKGQEEKGKNAEMNFYDGAHS